MQDLLNVFYGLKKEYMHGSNNIEKNSEDTIEESIYRINNNIYFNNSIGAASINRLIELSREIIYSDNIGGYPDYTLYMNSYGGYLCPTFRYIDFLEMEVFPRTSSAKVIIHGVAASAGAIISCVFKTRLITKRSVIMIHELCSGVGGNYTSIKSYIDKLNFYNDNMIDIIRNATNLTNEEIYEKLMKETWFTPEKALGYNLVHKII